MNFKTHQEIDNYYRKQGVDVDKLNQEINDVEWLLDVAIKRTRKRWGFFKSLFTPTWIGFAQLNPEINKEFKELQDKWEGLK